MMSSLLRQAAIVFLVLHLKNTKTFTGKCKQSVLCYLDKRGQEEFLLFEVLHSFLTDDRILILL
jgi:hypothetical protein